MQMTEAELALQAQESSKGAMSDADRQFFARFYSQQRKELIIQAIEREVSMLMVDGYLGKRMIIKKPNCFNEFMKTPQARSVFRGPHKGVKDKTVMGGVASRWHALTPEEQEKFRKAARSKPLPDADDDNPDDGSESNTDEDDKQPISTALKSGICRTISFKRASEQVANFMDLWVKQAVHIAKTCNCEMVFFAVSRHLGLHSFQYTQSTHDLAALAEGKKTKNKAVSAVARMSTLVAEKTNGALTQWPWTNTDEVLAEVKYRVVLLPGGKTQLKWIKSPSRDLHVKPQAVLLNDLENNLINVVHDPTMPDPVKSPKFTKRITEKKQPPKHASKGRFRKRIPSTSSTASLDSEQIATTPSASENSKTGQQEGSGASENGTDLGDI
ncbi:hypothetical protein PtB15_2B879 [Puccinia triticina]|nr:hypothetical protein PtB15_2B879 [Puccinia triticina]